MKILIAAPFFVMQEGLLYRLEKPRSFKQDKVTRIALTGDLQRLLYIPEGIRGQVNRLVHNWCTMNSATLENHAPFRPFVQDSTGQSCTPMCATTSSDVEPASCTPSEHRRLQYRVTCKLRGQGRW